MIISTLSLNKSIVVTSNFVNIAKLVDRLVKSWRLIGRKDKTSARRTDGHALAYMPVDMLRR